MRFAIQLGAMPGCDRIEKFRAHLSVTTLDTNIVALEKRT
jgi:hypothetical protein